MSPINVVLAWHMHQPEYRDLATGEYRLPWTYLHAIKDYVDMAAHLERYDDARAVVNFAPILLEQLEDYSGRISENLDNGRKIPDRLLTCLVADDEFIFNIENRLWLIEACLKVNCERLVKRYPAYKDLVRIAEHLTPGGVEYLYRQFFIDLVVWYHLAWMGETVKRENPVIKRLIEKARKFSPQDRQDLLAVIGDIIAGIIPRYKKLADQNRIELSMSPFAHPMLPLLIDFNTTREAMPDAPLPESAGYPDGAARCHWHIEQGLQIFERCFGRKPEGCWPSEGGISDAAVRMLDQHGFKWLATGKNVLTHSLSKQPDDCDLEHLAFHLEGAETRMFFRDDGLSDLVGFTYSDWHADDAVGDLIHHIHTIRQRCDNPQQHVVSIVLDGENAWEHYPENGYYFLDALYQRLSTDGSINITTFNRFLEKSDQSRRIHHLVAGSWVYGSFSTWIGDAAKNRAWDLLCQAKTDLDNWLSTHAGHAAKDEILKQLAICEGSDWFWWFGDYNPSTSVRDFDELYRLNLKNLYRLAELKPPDTLDTSLSSGNSHSTAEGGGTMRRGG